MTLWVQLLGASPPPPKIYQAKNVQNLARFRIRSEFDREYRRNGLGCRQAEIGVINHYPSYVRRKKNQKLGFLVNFSRLQAATRI